MREIAIPLPSIDSVICSRLFPRLSPSMPRPRYRIIAADVRVVHRWIRERLRNDVWPEDWPRLMQAVIKASRRDLSRYRTVRLSRNAHKILSKLAMCDKLTLSEVIERYFSCVAHVTTPAQADENPIVAAYQTLSISRV
jgi:hypothetical protein